MTDRRNECGFPALLHHCVAEWIVQLGWCVTREAEGRATECVGNPGHARSVGHEVRMYMLNVMSSAPDQEDHGLGDCRKCAQETTLATPRHLDTYGGPANQSARASQQQQCCTQQGNYTQRKQEVRLCTFGQIALVGQIGRRSQGEAVYFPPKALESLDLPTDERVTHRRIEIDHIADQTSTIGSFLLTFSC